MKRERGWFQIGAGLVLFLSFVVVLAGCAKVTVQCTPPNAMSQDSTPPTGVCGKNAYGKCMKNAFCTC